MSAIAFTVIGKDNKPLYIREFFRDGEVLESEEELFGLPPRASPDNNATTAAAAAKSCSLRQQFILHAALDRFEQLAGPQPGCAWRAPGVSGSDAMFVGLLLPVEDMRVYGYMTTTQIKFLLTVEDDASVGIKNQRTADEIIKRLFVKLHRVFVEYRLNPFSPMTGPIESSRFDHKVGECVNAYNRTLV